MRKQRIITNYKMTIWTVQQITIGLRYKFFTTGKTDETENK